jgi:hypothetical protein
VKRLSSIEALGNKTDTGIMSDEARVKLVTFTESVTVFASDAQVGRATIDAVAKSLELRLDKVVEERRVLSTRFMVMLTGTASRLKASERPWKVTAGRAAGLLTSWS